MKQIAGMMLLALVTGTGVHAQTSAIVKDDLFTGTEAFAKGATDVTEVTMDPDTLGMVGGRDKAKAHTMMLNVVRTYRYDKPGMYNIADVEVFRNKLNTGDWHCSVHTRSSRNSQSTDVCNKHRSDDMVETAIITVEPKELTFIHTIRKRGGNEGMGSMGPIGPGDAMMMIMPDMSSVEPELQAQIAITRAQMGAMAARIRAEGVMQSAQLTPQIRLELHGLSSDALKNIKPMDEKQLQQLKDSVQDSLKEIQKQSEKSDKKPE